jgi:hypothetical protein
MSFIGNDGDIIKIIESGKLKNLIKFAKRHPRYMNAATVHRAVDYEQFRLMDYMLKYWPDVSTSGLIARIGRKYPFYDKDVQYHIFDQPECHETTDEFHERLNKYIGDMLHSKTYGVEPNILWCRMPRSPTNDYEIYYVPVTENEYTIMTDIYNEWISKTEELPLLRSYIFKKLLDLSAAGNYAQLMDYLLSECGKLSPVIPTGKTLKLAVTTFSYNTVKRIAEHGSYLDTNHGNLFTWAVINRNIIGPYNENENSEHIALDILELLVEAYPRILKTKHRYDIAPLHDVKTIREASLFVHAGYPINSIVNGMTPLDSAIYDGRTNIEEYLCSIGGKRAIDIL